jgi:hypothetical protein
VNVFLVLDVLIVDISLFLCNIQERSTIRCGLPGVLNTFLNQVVVTISQIILAGSLDVWRCKASFSYCVYMRTN